MMSWGAPAFMLASRRWFILMMSTSLWVRSSSDRSPVSSVIDGRTDTGGTRSAVITIHSGLAYCGSKPSTRRSLSGTPASQSRTSVGSIIALSLKNVVGLMSLTSGIFALQCGQLDCFFFAFAFISSSTSASIFCASSSISSSEISILLQEWQVDLSMNSICLANSGCMTGRTSSMCAKCPGQERILPPQVLHLRPGSMTPILGSTNPPSIG
ncbi:Uncharacterised protein [uncultured archaeon]|nr:Uncharacterised protein [uncultured archaeon]